MANSVGPLIKEARTRAKLSQEALAGKIEGLSASDLGKAERGEKELSQATLKQIAKLTGVTQSSLINAAKESTYGPAKKTAASTTKKPAEKTASAAKKTTASTKKPAARRRKKPSPFSRARGATLPAFSPVFSATRPETATFWAISSAPRWTCWGRSNAARFARVRIHPHRGSRVRALSAH